MGVLLQCTDHSAQHQQNRNVLLLPFSIFWLRALPTIGSSRKASVLVISAFTVACSAMSFLPASMLISSR